MRPVFLVHVTGSRPHAIDFWTKPYKYEHIAEGQASRRLARSRSLGGNWTAAIYRIGEEDYRGNNPGPVLRFLRAAS